jgi:pimeloyl-ACP methyl ester carboxylesterase
MNPSVVPPNASETVVSNATHGPRTVTLDYAAGPLVVDVWEARESAETPPILLIHGWGGSGSYWASTARALSRHSRVIVPDLPGTGRSQPVRRTHNLFDQVAALAYVLDALDVQRVHVIGHSMGGAMALLLADAHPERIDRLILTSVSFFLTDEQKAIYHAIMKVFKIGMNFRFSWMADMPVLSRLMAQRYFYRIPSDTNLLRQGFIDYLELDAATAIACANDAAIPAIPEAGARVEAPTLLVACRQDQVMPVDNVEFTAQTIPNCEVRWLDKCGHMPMIEKPDAYFAIVRAFFNLPDGVNAETV